MCRPCYDERIKLNLAQITSEEKEVSEAKEKVKIKEELITQEFYRKVSSIPSRKRLPEMPSETVCSICHDAVDAEKKDVMMLRCGHFFHADCINRWFKYYDAVSIEYVERVRKCPYCQNEEDMTEVLHIVSTKTVEDQKERPSLGDNILERYPFVVDIPNERWESLIESQQENMMRFNHLDEVRYVYMKQSYGIIQSSSGIQISLYERLDYPHGHRIIRPCRTAEYDNIILVKPTDYLKENEFVSQMIVTGETVKILNTIWKRILEQAISEYDGDLLADAYVERQRLYFDRGTNSGPAHGRNYSVGKKKKVWLNDEKTFGIAVPMNNVVEGTERLTDDIFRAFSILIKRHAPFLWSGRDPERVKQFCEDMVSGNIIEAFRACAYPFDINRTVYTRSFLCNDHMDTKNDPQFPGVITFSTMIWKSEKLRGKIGWRVAVICYTRKSIGDFYKRQKEKCGPAIKFALNVFSNFPCWRKDIHKLAQRLDKFVETETHPKISGSGRYSTYRTFQCHCNPMVYYSSVVDCIAILTMKYSLDYVEVVSLIRAYTALPSRVYYFVLITAFMIHDIELYDRHLHKNRGPLIGYFYWKLMEKLYLIDLKEKKKRPRRFQSYTPQRSKTPFTETLWLEEVHEVSFHWIKSWSKLKSLSSKKILYKEYGHIYTKTDKWKYAGPLIINHALGIASILGLIPIQFITCFHKASDSPGLQHFKNQHGVPTGNDEMNRFLDCFIAALKKEFAYYATRKISENIGCKVGRFFGEGKKGIIMGFLDIYFEGQNFYFVEQNHDGIFELHVLTTEMKDHIIHGPLFPNWRFNGVFLTPIEYLSINSEAFSGIEQYELPTTFARFGENFYTAKIFFSDYFAT